MSVSMGVLASRTWPRTAELLLGYLKEEAANLNFIVRTFRFPRSWSLGSTRDKDLGYDLHREIRV